MAYYYRTWTYNIQRKKYGTYDYKIEVFFTKSNLLYYNLLSLKFCTKLNKNFRGIIYVQGARKMENLPKVPTKDI